MLFHRKALKITTDQHFLVKGKGFAIFMLMFGLILMQSSMAHAESRRSGLFYDRDFTLNGNVTLSYETSWGSKSEPTNRFTHSLDLGLNGFVIDPRLMTFTVGGIFAQSMASNKDTYTIEGFSTVVRFLNERPRLGILRFFPQPIELRYAYSTDSMYQSQRYGISMQYRPEKKKSPYVQDFTVRNNNQNTGNDNQNKGQREKYLLFPLTSLPHFFFDYNRYERSSEKYSNTYDRLSLRAVAHSKHAEYFAEYRYDKNSDSNFSSKTQYLELRTNLSYYWKETSSRLESYNTFFVQDTGQEKTVSFYDHTSWVKNFGINLRDSFMVNGGGRYFARDNKADYALNLDAGYNKFFSERFINHTAAGVSYTGTENDTLVAETVSNSFQYNLSRGITFTNGVRVGRGHEGAFYDFSIGLQVRSIISINPGYAFAYSELEGTRRTSHSFSLNLSGPLLRGMTFYSQNYYIITDDSSVTAPFKEKRLSLTANALWRISRYNISLGASYLDTTVGGLDQGIAHGGGVKTTFTTISANVSTYLSRRLALNVNAYYQKMNRGPYRAFISPLLNWQWRRVTLIAQYTMNINGNSQTDHRLSLRVTRQLDGSLRPFF